MEIKIDGQTIVLTPVQAEQFKKAVLKETALPGPRHCGNTVLHCKNTGRNGSYPLVMISSHKVPCEWGCGNISYGRDFSLTELKGFIKDIKAYAAKIWTTAEKELENV